MYAKGRSFVGSLCLLPAAASASISSSPSPTRPTHYAAAIGGGARDAVELDRRGPRQNSMTPAPNGALAHTADMQAIFPEALQTLQQADPEVAAIIEDEKRRQWCAAAANAADLSLLSLFEFCCRVLRGQQQPAGAGAGWSRAANGSGQRLGPNVSVDAGSGCGQLLPLPLCCRAAAHS